MAVPPAPSFYGDTIPAVVTPTDTIRFRAYCADAITLSAYFEPYQNDPMPIWYEADIEPDDVWNDVPVFYVEIPLAQTSVTAGKWRIGIQAHNNDGYSLHSFKDVRVAELPTVEITSPTEGATVNTLPLVITWNSSDATGISEQQLYVYDEDLINLVLYRTLDGDARTSVIGIEDAAFENDSEYIVIVGAFNGVGLYSSDTVHFRTHWAAPAVPTATVTTDPTDLSASVTAFGNVTYDLGEGEELTVREGGMLASLTVLGKSVQDGTPSPSSPVPIQSVEPTSGTSISLVLSDGTVTPIDLQGNELRSLPDGTHDELTVDADGNVGMVQRVGRVVLDGAWSGVFIVGSTAVSSLKVFLLQGAKFNEIFGASAAPRRTGDVTDRSSVYCDLLPGRVTAYNTWTDIGISGWTDASAAFLFAPGEGLTTSDEFKTWLNEHPLTITYPLATPQTISLGTVDLPYADAGSTVSVDAVVTPTISGTVKTMEYAGQPATNHLVVARVNADGTRWVIADDVASGESVTDPLPPLGVEYSYAVTAVTEAGTTSVATVAHTVESTAWALNFGANASEAMTLVGNPKASYSLDQGGEAYHFADGGAGGGLPVWYGTTDRDESGTLSFDTKGPQESDRLRELCRQYPVGWIRDPFGHRWRAHVQPKISHGIGDTWQVSINWDAVRFEEAW